MVEDRLQTDTGWNKVKEVEMEEAGSMLYNSYCYKRHGLVFPELFPWHLEFVQEHPSLAVGDSISSSWTHMLLVPSPRLLSTMPAPSSTKEPWRNQGHLNLHGERVWSLHCTVLDSQPTEGPGFDPCQTKPGCKASPVRCTTSTCSFIAGVHWRAGFLLWIW